MPKITSKQLDTAKEWADWGDRLGWTYIYCEIGTDKTKPHAVFKVDERGTTEEISLVTRHALQRQDKTEPSNVAKIA